MPCTRVVPGKGGRDVNPEVSELTNGVHQGGFRQGGQRCEGHLLSDVVAQEKE